ncbi:MAG TPA: EF-P lysine aminoacylase EpmA [Myxococcales bacterium LLY-WYZ-16_1]|jgi:elongation factor P--(R)-beta-lysine ligase|nr:EF-P lysine aminoacylase EpmA [Myxococcales bacterium LLY-WYZ-16_1]
MLPLTARLAARKRMLDGVRRHFDRRGFLEVETPVLVTSPGLEPHLEPFETDQVGPDRRRRRRYLHTSPEYGMKKLLGRGLGPIYQVARVFRNGEASATHVPEFTMLEFYRRPGRWNQVAEDAVEVVFEVARAVRGTAPATVRTVDVRTLFLECGAPDPLDPRAGAAWAARQGAPPNESPEDRFFRAFFEAVEPRLPADQLTVLTGYPADQAALAELDPEDPRRALRFELFWGDLELGNGFQELTDPLEQRRRFEDEQAVRRRLGRVVPPQDPELLRALPAIREAAGIAIGLDRVLMRTLGQESVQAVLPW